MSISDNPILVVSGSFVDAPERISANRKVYEWVKDEWDFGSSWKAAIVGFFWIVTVLPLVFGAIPAWTREVDSAPDNSLLGIRSVKQAVEGFFWQDELFGRLKNYAANWENKNPDTAEIQGIQKSLLEHFKTLQTAKDIAGFLEAIHKIIGDSSKNEFLVTPKEIKFIKEEVFDQIISKQFFRDLILQHKTNLEKPFLDPIKREKEWRCIVREYLRNMQEAVDCQLFTKDLFKEALFGSENFVSYVAFQELLSEEGEQISQLIDEGLISKEEVENLLFKVAEKKSAFEALIKAADNSTDE